MTKREFKVEHITDILVMIHHMPTGNVFWLEDRVGALLNIENKMYINGYHVNDYLKSGLWLKYGSKLPWCTKELELGGPNGL